MQDRRKKQEEEQGKQEQCLFKPYMISQEKSQHIISPEYVSSTVEQRNNNWLLQKEKKVERQKEKDKEKEIVGCSFKPTFFSSDTKLAQNSENTISRRSIDRYIELQKKLKIAKEENKKAISEKTCSGKKWTHKQTVPKAPSFMKESSSKQNAKQTNQFSINKQAVEAQEMRAAIKKLHEDLMSLSNNE